MRLNESILSFDITSAAKDLTRIGALLTDIGYADCFGHFAHHPYSYARIPAYLQRLRRVLPRDLRLAIRLFALAEPVGQEELASSELGKYVSVLTDLGVLNKVDSAGTIRTNDLQCHAVDGLLLFVSVPSPAQDICAYFGDDSVKLSRHLAVFAGDRAIDICCGSGIQTLTMARKGAHVLGLDIQPRAIHLARINCCLNRLNNVEFSQRDVLNEAITESADFISCNPPLVPIPSDLEYSVVGDGGEDGLRFLEVVVRAFENSTQQRVRACVVGLCLGSDTSVGVVKWLRTRLPKDISAHVYLINRYAASAMNASIAWSSAWTSGGDPNRALRRLGQLTQKCGCTHYYTYMLKVFHEHGSGVIEVPLYKESDSQVLWYGS